MPVPTNVQQPANKQLNIVPFVKNEDAVLQGNLHHSSAKVYFSGLSIKIHENCGSYYFSLGKHSKL